MTQPFSHAVLSDLFGLEHVLSDVHMACGKNILIDVLRNVFAQDREYCYRTDPFGFPLVRPLAGFSPSAGLDDTETTRIFIGSSFYGNTKFNPSIIIKNTGSRYVPVSFNQNLLGIVNRKEIISDGYGNSATIYTPAYHTIVGAWDQTFEIKVVAESETDREEISDIIQVTLMGTRRMDLQNAGLFIKSMSTGGEQEDRFGNDYLFSVAIAIDTRSEWRIHVPITDVVERIGVCLAFKTIDGSSSDALSVNEQITTIDTL